MSGFTRCCMKTSTSGCKGGAAPFRTAAEDNAAPPQRDISAMALLPPWNAWGSLVEEALGPPEFAPGEVLSVDERLVALGDCMKRDNSSWE